MQKFRADLSNNGTFIKAEHLINTMNRRDVEIANLKLIEGP
jgi:hypothetical protein